MAKQCVQLTMAQVQVLVAEGWTLHSGPHLTQEECEAICSDEVDTGTGTGTGTGTVQAIPGTGTGTVSGCNWCDDDIAEIFLLEITNGCPVLPSLWEMQYDPVGAYGAGWYSSSYDYDGDTFLFYVACISGAPGTVQVQMVKNGDRHFGTSVFPDSCNPLSAGNAGSLYIPSPTPCTPFTIVKLYSS